ncbi:MAG TPA: aminopeptidase P N-terminal domain-containing protein [Terriglobales bacterium]|jgi:Xaa-Pro aminopeptidase|nr:aminopeptidase P N-terminal domain-containing protein [Terriglobales bacterium]
MIRRLLAFFILVSTLSPLHALDRQPNADYHARRQALAAKMGPGILLLFAPMEAEGPNDLYGFRQNDDFFYLTGWIEPGAAILVTAATDSHPYTEILFLPAHNRVQERWTGPKLGAENPDAGKITGFDKVDTLDHLRDVVVPLLPLPRSTFYSDLPAYGDISASTGPLDWLKRANAFAGYVSFEDVKPTLAALRTFKDAGEIERLRKASDASVAAHFAALKAMKPGVTEREISALLQYEWGKRGCERPAYAPIVGSGYNSTVLHYSDDSATIKDGDLVVIDAAGEYAMYASDITRTMPANGKFTARQREIYDVVYGAHQAAIAAFKSGKSNLKREGPDSLYKIAYDYINTHGKDKHGQPLGQYFIHGLSHYVGLNVHDDNDYSLPLGPGSVFTIEPGIYIPEESLGVRIEDIFYVDKDGKLINMSGALPHSADEVERAMATGK